MNVGALVLYAVFAAIAFGWRTWLQWRRTGDTGLRMRAEPGSTQWWAKLGFIFALLTGAASPVGGIAGLDPISFLDTTVIKVCGVVLAIVGIAATAWAQWQMGSSWRIGVDPAERTGPVTGGAFALARNPIFSTMVVTATGLALMVGNGVAVAGLAALIVALEVQVRLVEEPYLRAVHGSAYTAYAAIVGRFVPGVGRSRDTGASDAAPEVGRLSG